MGSTSIFFGTNPPSRFFCFSPETKFIFMIPLARNSGWAFPKFRWLGYHPSIQLTKLAQHRRIETEKQMRKTTCRNHFTLKRVILYSRPRKILYYASRVYRITSHSVECQVTVPARLPKSVTVSPTLRSTASAANVASHIFFSSFRNKSSLDPCTPDVKQESPCFVKLSG